MPFRGWLVLPQMQTIIDTLQSLSTLQLCVVGVFVVSLCVHLFYYFFFFIRMALFKQPEISTNFEPVSVIICAWNEEDNLKKHLQNILEQD